MATLEQPFADGDSKAVDHVEGHPLLHVAGGRLVGYREVVDVAGCRREHVFELVGFRGTRHADQIGRRRDGEGAVGPNGNAIDAGLGAIPHGRRVIEECDALEAGLIEVKAVRRADANLVATYPVGIGND